MDKTYTSKSLVGHTALADDIVEDVTGILERLKQGRAPSEGELLGIKAVAGNLAYATRAMAEHHCPGHVASPDDNKICGHCGVRVGAMR